ncbi:DUF1254 domain-containing protein [Edaphobacter modestus]|uniref:DUF1254 domain-containing protein n=1 Tax=Edaphobacter modestus TaxID=388466 RepID=A0A4V2G498_9BACT|nr:DUF1254 domain-containing protein [Edaphobacter modestus]RZU40066.1 hypothetical protein BDD14_1490 [Edaphobacter modestus]
MQRRHALIVTVLTASLIGCEQQPKQNRSPAAAPPGLLAAASGYIFQRGFPIGNTAQKAYDDADLNRAVEAYRFFYPTVSGSAIFKGNAKLGVIPNKVFGTLDTQPRHVGFTLNSDTPYAPLLLDLTDGPMVVELPPGPLICIAMDINQLWVADLGLPGPAAGKGDKVVFLPPGYKNKPPAGYRIATSPSNKMLVGIRSLPVNGDVPGAIARIKTVKVHPLKSVPGWPETQWLDLTPPPEDTTPLAWENNMQFWRELYEVINTEVPNPRFHNMYGELAALGLEKGKPFSPDARMTAILERAAKIGNAQMRVESFGDRRPDRIVWPDRKWEWAALRFEDGDFNTSNYADLYARDKWFYQAIGASPAMFKRDPTAGSLYWLGLRDSTGATLDGSKSYKLSVPQPVPGKLFWSVTVYDTDTRSQVITDQAKAALRSMFELKDVSRTQPTELYFGPKAPQGHEDQWIKTISGKGWFVYFRVYGPEKAAFDGSWKPGDFEEVK